MTQREAVVEEAKKWRGAKYHDRAAIPYIACDCATFPLMVYSRAGVIEWDGTLPFWSPQDWLHNHNERKYLDRAEKEAVEISEESIGPGDLALYRVVHSWTHGAIIIEWPRYVLHPVVGLGVIGSHGTQEGFLKHRPRRFFRFVREGV